jgi:Protein of unknown function (DUF3667)
MATGDQLLEAVTEDTIAHELTRASKHSLPIGAPCPNCHTALAGPWCYACGQRGEEFHRSILRLAWEAVEGLTDLDGRLWQTLPRLIVKPGQLTRDYLDGHRAAQIPPFRLFLIVLVLVFFTGALNFQANHVNFKVPANSFMMNGSGDQADFKKATDAMNTTANGRWLVKHGQAALKDPDAYMRSLADWAHQFAILMLPIAALMLSLLFVFKRGVYVFDHLIFSMHSLAFQGLLISGVFLGGMAVDWAGVLLWLAPVHLFIHMRRTYWISTLGTLVRMFLLFNLSAVAFVFLMLGLAFAGLTAVH